MQLDIFEHSRDVMIRSDVVAALERGEPVAARAGWQVLHAEFPADDCLPALDVLVSTLDRQCCAHFTDHAAARLARLDLQQRVEPAALRMLGQGPGARWLALRWQALALRATRLAFDAEQSDEHAAPLLLRAGDWAAATAVVAGIDAWRRIPAPLSWMAEARTHTHGLDAAWPLLAELAWLSPTRFEALSKALRDPLLEALLGKFNAEYEGDGAVADLAWFAAWVLIEEPALAPRLNEATPSLGSAPEQAMRLMVALRRLERQGRHHELVLRRKALRSLNPALFGAYMKTR